MLDFLFKDKDGNKCLAKTAYVSMLVTVIWTIIYSTYKVQPVDFTGLATILAAAGGAYGWRSQTKAVSNVKLDK